MRPSKVRRRPMDPCRTASQSASGSAPAFTPSTNTSAIARDLGVPMRISNLALADVQEAMNRGWAERDCRSVMLLPQERAGVQIKVDSEAVHEVLGRDPSAPTDTKYGTGA